MDVSHIINSVFSLFHEPILYRCMRKNEAAASSYEKWVKKKENKSIFIERVKYSTFYMLSLFAFP